MKLNRKWMLVIALVLSMATAISGTLAYLTSTDTAKNTFTVGNVSIDLQEPNYPGNTPTLLPGVEIAKDPQIKNTGSTEAWVWMEITVPTDLMSYIDWNTADWTKTETTSGNNTVVTMKRATKLPAGETTATAFTKVALPASLTSMPESLAASGTVDIVVDAYAIQDANFANIDAAIAAYDGEGGEEEPTLPTTSWDTTADTDWYNEDATTYEISTAEQLAGLAQMVNDAGMNARFLANKTVELTADIDLSGKLWTPIGKANVSAFWGTFDGNGHTISNVVVNEPTMEGAGLFGAVFFSGDWARTAGVRNLTVKNATIIAKENAAAIVGHSYGSVDGCTVENATITVAEGKAGAIVGSTASDSAQISISNNTAEDITVINAEGNDEVGGIAGRIWTSLCTFEGNDFENATVNGADLDKAIGVEY